MPITKNALIRYQALDRCFSNPGRRYDIAALLEACNKALFEFNPKSVGIQKRQLYEDIRFMESDQGYGVEFEKTKEGRRTFYRYAETDFSINKNPINELEAEQLKSAMMVLTRFKGMPQFEWINELLPKLDQTFSLTNSSEDIMSFESNLFLKGVEFLDDLFNAVLYKKSLQISYQSFKSDKPNDIMFHPYHLKQFNSRWFVFGKNEDYDNISNLALDRILKIEESQLSYHKNTTTDFREYFEDIVGVTFSDTEELTNIKLKVDIQLAPYIITKPLHGSQKKIEEKETYVIFSLNVIPNFELEKLILSFGEQMEVISPIEFREKIKSRLTNNINNYD
jgi:predicted DNA-binding transcriptional regulator YafY